MQGQHHFFVMTAKRQSVLDIIIIFLIVVLVCNSLLQVCNMSPQIKRANLGMMTLERSGRYTSTRMSM